MTNIVILTGAGISAESGLGTFRDKGGIWTKYDLSEVATPEGFARHPEKVQEFYNARRVNALAAKPNAAHYALARLEAEFPEKVTIVTQNIDDLHERAGSRAVVHMHGEVMRALCSACRRTWKAPAKMNVGDLCPFCGAQATRPDIVWFGEIPYHMEMIDELVGTAGTFVAIGTSGQVYPAAGFAASASAAGAVTVELNLEPSDISRDFNRTILGPASEVVPEWVNCMLAKDQ